MLPPILLSVALFSGCGSAPCDEGQARAGDGTCIDLNGDEERCDRDSLLSSDIEESERSFTSFAYSELDNGTVLVLGFEDERDGCQVVQDHVEGRKWWHDGAIAEARFYGDWAAGGEVEVSDQPEATEHPLSMNLTISVMDEGREESIDGEATLAAITLGEPLEISELTASFESGAAAADTIRACHCPDVARFWDVVPPEETGDTDTDPL